MGGVTWAREKEPNRVEMLPGIVSSTPFKSTGAPRKHNQEGLRERKGGPGPCWPRLGSAGPSGRSGPSPPAPPPASRHPPGCRAARRLRAQGLPRPAGPENAPDGGRPPPGGGNTARERVALAEQKEKSEAVADHPRHGDLSTFHLAQGKWLWDCETMEVTPGHPQGTDVPLSKL